MKTLQKAFSKFFKRYWPFLIIACLIFIFFYPVWLHGKIPLPGDFIVGTYFPWLDYKWGYSVGVPVKNPITSDVVSVIYPLRMYAIDQIKSGQLPLWNSAMLGGYPLLANFQVAILSPTILFYFLLPNVWAWTAQVIVQPLISAIGMYLLLRHFGLKKLSSVFGGIVFAFSGFSMIWLEWNAHSLVAAFIPYILLSFDKLLTEDKVRNGILLSIFLCLQLFSGYPQVSFYTLFLIGLWGLFRVRKVGIKRLLLSAPFIILGIILSLIQTLPGFELLFNSQRQGEILDANLRYLPWKNLIVFLAPDFFGNPSTGNFWGVGNYTLNTHYTGIVTFLLAIYGFLKTKLKVETLFFLIILLISLGLAFPSPFTEGLYQQNLIGLSALSPTRMFVLVNFSIAALGSFGLDNLRKKKNSLIILYFLLAVVGCLFLGIFVYSRQFAVGEILKNNLQIGIRNLIIPTLLILSLGFAIFINKFSKFKKVSIYLIFFLMVVELFRYGWKFTPFSLPELAFPETPVLTYLKHQKGPFRISGGDTISMNMWIPYALESMSGYDAAFPLTWAKLNAVIRNMNPDVSPVNRYAELETYNSSWFDLLNIKYVVALKRTEGLPSSGGEVYYKLQDPKFKKVFEDRSTAVLENTKSSPRAFMVGDWESLDEHATLSSLVNPDFPLHKKILLAENFDEFNKNQNIKSKTSYLSYTPNKYSIETESDNPGFLFVSDTFYPGWEAYVDGKVQKIYKADYNFKTIPVGAGKHLVEFIYAPRSFYLGFGLFMLSMLILLAIPILKLTTRINSK